MNHLLRLVVSSLTLMTGVAIAAPAQDGTDKPARARIQVEASGAERAQPERAQQAPAAKHAPPHDRVKRPEPLKRVDPSDRIRLDQRHSHNHYYPPRGHVAPVLPSGSLSVRHGSGHFFFHGGVWFRPAGPRFIVSVPPIGIVVPILPPTYTTLWVAGVPYYYANGIYYAPARAQGYTVVAPPADVEITQTVVQAPDPANLPEQIIYPRNGQSVEQMEADRQDCNRWALTQPNAQVNASIFQRAIAACMDGRGYTVR